MTKVITYGTYDLLHYGHKRLLERAKTLGDYLIVGVTSDDFDRARGKINVQQSFMERVEGVRATGLADEIIAEEYEGQKIDDIKRFGVDIFAIGSDWKGKFDYLEEYCKVVYLDRTQGISSTEIRSKERSLRIGLVGNYFSILNKFYNESKFVNGVSVSGIYSDDPQSLKDKLTVYSSYEDLLDNSDAVYITSLPKFHYQQIHAALEHGKHVLCESPICLEVSQWDELQKLAKEKNCLLIDSLKTAYSLAYSRLLLLAKGGKIGNIVSVDATCTSMSELQKGTPKLDKLWNSINAWGPTALLPVFQLLGTDFKQMNIMTHYLDKAIDFDAFTKVSFIYPHAVASIKVGQGVKSEGELIISGTQGYIYVPAPWWKTDYFEIRYENPVDNKRFFYQLDGEGIRYEIVSFAKAVESKHDARYIEGDISEGFVKVMESYNGKENLIEI
jgi:choline-phosphate cytidylyltransferase